MRHQLWCQVVLQVDSIGVCMFHERVLGLHAYATDVWLIQASCVNYVWIACVTISDSATFRSRHFVVRYYVTVEATSRCGYHPLPSQKD